MASDVTLDVDIITQGLNKLDDISGKLDGIKQAAGAATPNTTRLGKSLGSAGLVAAGNLAASAVEAVTSRIGEFVKSSLNAASRTEGLRNGLKTVVPDATEFAETLARIDKQARLPGLQKNDLLGFTTSMRAAGLDAEQTESALTILGSRIVGFGQTSAEAAQVVGQFTQAMNRGKIEGDELNRLFESLPGFKNIVVEMTGVSGGAQDLNDHFADLGLSVQDGMIPLLEAYDESLGAIDHDSALVKADAFEGALEDLKNTIGKALLPAYKDILDEGAKLLDFFSGLVTGTEELPDVFKDIVKPLEKFESATDDLLDALSPLLTPLRNLGEAVLPLLRTVWIELVGYYTDFLIPTFTKVVDAISPLIASIINLIKPIVNLVNHWLPPLMSVLKSVATTIVDIVIVPIRNLAGAFSWVIDKITELIELIPGAKKEVESQGEAHKAVADEAAKEAVAIEAVTTATKTQTAEAGKNKKALGGLVSTIEATATRQDELKVAVAKANIELKNAKAALEAATTPDEIEAASARIKTAIENVKEAKINEAATFESESKKQIAIVKAEAEALASHDKARKEALELQADHLEGLSEAAETESEKMIESYKASVVGINTAIENSDFPETVKRVTEQGLGHVTAQTNQIRQYIKDNPYMSDEAKAALLAKLREVDTESQTIVQTSQEKLTEISTTEKEKREALIAEEFGKWDSGSKSAVAAFKANLENAKTEDEVKAEFVKVKTALEGIVGEISSSTDLSYTETKTLTTNLMTEITGAAETAQQKITTITTEELAKQKGEYKALVKDTTTEYGTLTSAFAEKIKEAKTKEALDALNTDYYDSLETLLTNFESSVDTSTAEGQKLVNDMIAHLDQQDPKWQAVFEKAMGHLGAEAKKEAEIAQAEIDSLATTIEGIFEDSLDLIKDLVAGDVSIGEAFKNLGADIGNKLLGELTSKLSGKLAEIILGADGGKSIAETVGKILSGDTSGVSDAVVGKVAGAVTDAGTDAGTDAATTVATTAGAKAAGTVASGAALGTAATVGLAVAVPAAVFAATYLIGRKFAGGDDDATALLERGEIRNVRGTNILQSNALKALANSNYPEAQKTAALDAGIAAGQSFRNKRRGESDEAYQAAKERAIQGAIASALAQAQVEKPPEVDENTPEDPNALFHFTETDRMAQDVGGDIVRAMFKPSDTQRQNAQDFSDNVRGGALREIARMRGGGQGKQVINLEVPVITKIGDKETRQVTKRQLELDNMNTNFSNTVL